jgi:hypothetical protein
MAIVTTSLTNTIQPNDKQIKLGSLTGITAPGPNKSNRTILWMGREAIEVLSLADATNLIVNVVRGVLMTAARYHGAGTQVWAGAEKDFPPFEEQGLGLYARLAAQFETVNIANLIGTTTLTAENLLGVLILGIPTAAANYTLPTAALLLASLGSYGSPYIGQSFEFTIINNSAGAFAITLVAGTGGTVVGTATVAQANGKRFRVVITGVAVPAYSVYSEGTVTV